ncbi:hypothetical protein A1Q2_06840 [Trichosporon asahii var. asahii CBS 8904]|uniref:DM2 domain-containing protein n=1 Tax=Trichosporon asahii var. asahii (strain CBS 8904) TaxID=1220162 RepID=K1V4F6_TRIAC|nr:hypothetical protein A1Q2_06840 [Trichosporon asahii var. asahii CBS 8904]
MTTQAVRKQLIAGGEDADTIKEHRGLIDERIGEIYEELTADNEEEDESEDDRKPTAKSESAEPASSQPEPLSAKHEQTDAAMAAQLQAEYDAAMRGSRGRRAAAPPKKTPKKKVSKKRVASDSDEEQPKKKRGGGGGAFNKELLLSDTLSAFVNETKLSRPQTVKRIWDYIKANDLQDPNDKRYILCDDKMKTVFHTDKLHMFTMNKLLAEHFRDPDHVLPPKKEEH